MIRLRVLGEVELFSATGAGLEAVIRQPKRLALLVYLLCGPRRFHRRDTLLALFWPDHDAAHARAALRRALFFLRRHLGDGVIETRGDDVAVTREGVWCDAIEFDAAMARGEPAVAVPLYRGPLLDGVFLPSAPDVERWLDDERPRRRRLAADGALALARTAEGAGDVAAATRWAGAAADLSDDEEALAFRLHLLTRFQRRDEALAVFQEFAAKKGDPRSTLCALVAWTIRARAGEREEQAGCARHTAKQPTAPHVRKKSNGDLRHCNP